MNLYRLSTRPPIADLEKVWIPERLNGDAEAKGPKQNGAQNVLTLEIIINWSWLQV